MSINIAKACQGEFYPFNEVVHISNDILSGVLAEFIGDVEVSGTYVMDKDNVYIDGELYYTLRFQCDRCLCPVEKTFNVRYTASFYLDGEEEIEGYYPYFNNVVDITESVGQEIIFNIPTRILCKPDCKGICPKCGTNLNEKSCDCSQSEENSTIIAKNNPFAALKDLNK